jgi:uncharacterized protein YndB with AHSA1/START domain
VNDKTLRLRRTVLIRAPRSIVFRYFTDSARFAAWWGAGSTIDPTPGGAVVIRNPNAIVASGHVESISPDERIVMTYGYENASHGMPPGSTRVTIVLREVAEGTELELVHELGTAAQREQHEAGWRYQLSVFANVVAREHHAAAPERLEAWFKAWNEPASDARLAMLEALAESDVSFQDDYAAIRGLADLHGHIGAIHVHMRGMRLERTGAARLCQGHALVDWQIRAPDGQVAGRGHNVFELSPTGRIRRVIGFRDP